MTIPHVPGGIVNSSFEIEEVMIGVTCRSVVITGVHAQENEKTVLVFSNLMSTFPFIASAH
jgi:hypothetical protein